MKPTAPIKRHQAIISFSRDHHFGLLLVWKIRQGLSASINPGRISRYVLYFFHEDLEKHFLDEETHLFSQLPENDTLRREAEAQHASIYSLVDEIRKEPHNSSLLRTLADELEEHIRFEERQLFNHLQEHLPAGVLETVEGRSASGGKHIDSAWIDNFWEK